MVGGHHGEVVRAQALPQVGLVALVLAAQRGRAHPLGALEARVRRAGPPASGTGTAGRSRRTRCGPASRAAATAASASARTCARSRPEPRRRRRARSPGWSPHPPSGRSGPPVPDRVGVAAGDRLRDQHVDRDAVLRVHHDERAVVRRPLHRAQDLAVVGVEHPGYAMNILKLVMPSWSTSWSIALSASSSTPPRIMWKP